jgi:hypothetical protein
MLSGIRRTVLAHTTEPPSELRASIVWPTSSDLVGLCLLKRELIVLQLTHKILLSLRNKLAGLVFALALAKRREQQMAPFTTSRRHLVAAGAVAATALGARAANARRWWRDDDDHRDDDDDRREKHCFREGTLARTIAGERPISEYPASLMRFVSSRRIVQKELAEPGLYDATGPSVILAMREPMRN